MLAIRAEIDRESGCLAAEDNPLVNARRNTQSELVAEWAHPYSREVAVFPGRRGRQIPADGAGVCRCLWRP